MKPLDCRGVEVGQSRTGKIDIRGAPERKPPAGLRPTRIVAGLGRLQTVAKHFNAGFASLVCRDAKDQLLSVSIYAEGEDAAALERWLKRREKKAQ